MEEDQDQPELANGDQLDENIGEMEEVVFSDMEDVVEDSDEGEMAADSGADVVLTPLRDDSALTFSQHQGSVFSVSVNGSGSLACSGAEDDRALVWKIADGSVAFQCHGHKDSVTCTGFSHDSKYVATADMAGLVQVWGTATGELVWSFELGDIEWLQWHPQAHVLLVGGSDGSGWMWRVPSGECKTFQGESARNSCAALTSDGKRICCGYDNGVVKVLSLKEGVPLVSLTGAQGHTKAVTCLATHHDNMLLLTGSEDETAKLINSNTGKVLSVFPAGFPPSEGSGGGGGGGGGDSEGGPAPLCGVESVCFPTTLPVALTGSLSGVLAVWDLSTQKLRQKCLHRSEGSGAAAGVVKVSSCRLSPVAYTGGLDGVVRGWDLRSGQLVREWHGHTGDILDLALLRSEGALLSASDDSTVRIFKTS